MTDGHMASTNKPILQYTCSTCTWLYMYMKLFKLNSFINNIMKNSKDTIVYTVEPPIKEPLSTSLQRTHFKVPNVYFPIFNKFWTSELWRKDNFSTKASPNMSSIHRFHCTHVFISTNMHTVKWSLLTTTVYTCISYQIPLLINTAKQDYNNEFLATTKVCVYNYEHSNT